MSETKFVHLSLHSEFSLKDSLISVNELIKASKDKNMHATAISDSSNLYASIKQYQKSLKAGLKPIISSEILLRSNNQIGHLNLIAQNNTGYKNIIELISKAYEEGQLIQDEEPMVDLEWLTGKTDGIIALSGARRGIIGKSLLADSDSLAQSHTETLNNLFRDNFYIELQRTAHPDDDKYVHKAVNLAIQNNLPVVATNSVVFMNPEDFNTHEVRSAIARKTSVSQLRENNPFLHTSEQYFKSAEEMAELFYDIPSAIENSVEIAKRCNIDITLGKSFLPEFPVPEGMNENSYLDHASIEGLNERLNQLYDTQSPDFNKIKEKYIERLNFELNVIKNMGFPGYFLIVADFIQWSKDNNIPVGPGRGSGAGSLVAYALKITDLDPIEYDLLFERFLNPERVSMPDFDVDFCMDRREEVIEYVANKYGKDAVAQIVTFGTMAAKMVVRDVARASGFPYAVGNKISNMIPGKPGTKLSDAIAENTELQLAIETDPEVKTVIDHSLKLEGKARQTGKHAGGVIIAPGKLTDFTATQNEISKDGQIINKVSQLDKNDVEEAGLVKFDFLGLKTLTIIQNAIDNINIKKQKNGEKEININSIPLQDEEVFKMFQEGKTTAVFQVESKGMKDLLKRMKPDRFEDLIALVALYRPGPLESGMVDNFINRKHGREEISYPDSTYQHESLKEILEPTYGVILYQEQVMQIAQVLAGYTLGGADMLRRAMGKKKPEEMEKQRSIFEQGAINNGVDGQLAMKIFDLVEKFAGYGFNKSHSAAYALIAYQTAWLKTHYPAEFMAAVLSGDMDNTDKIVTYVNECRNMDLKILPPNLNESIKSFSPTNKKEILYGLGAVKGVGDSAIHKIIEERNINGPYKSLYDYCMRCNANKNTIEAGIKSGILDSVGPSRASLMETYPQAISVGKQASKIEKDNPQMGMFGSIMDDHEIIKFKKVPEWNDLYRLAGERKTLGLYLTGHPIETYEEELSNIISGKLSDLAGSNMEEGNDDLEATEETASIKWEDKNVTVAGLIMDMEIRNNKRGQTGFLTIDDKSRQIDVMVFNKTLHNCQHVLQQDSTVVIEGKLKMDKRTKRIKLFAFDVKSIDMVRERNANNILLNFNTSNFNPDIAKELKSIIADQPEGYASIDAHYVSEKHNKRMQLGDKTIKITDQFINKLKEMFGKENVNIEYKEKEAKLGQKGKEATEQQKQAKIEEGQRTKKTRHSQMAAALDDARWAMGI